MPDNIGRIRTRAALAELLPGALTPEPFALTDLFARELDQYAEVIVGPSRRPAGFMTRGEDATFTERARLTLEKMGMPPEAVAHHKSLANWFEHKRAFLKLEWHPTDDGRASPLAACYFRRRPSVDEVLGQMVRWGMGAAIRELVMDAARLLEKDFVHFVSAAFKPGSDVHHKLYFSQWVTAESRDKVAERIARLFHHYGFPVETEELWQHNHARMLPADPDTTLFVSLSFTREGIAPSFKIDYPGVGAARAAVWLPEAEQVQVIEDAERACELAGTRAVTFLGVRFSLDSPVPGLKYYCDVPDRGEPDLARFAQGSPVLA